MPFCLVLLCLLSHAGVGENSGWAQVMTSSERNKGSRAFQTMRKLDASGNPTAEEFHYEFDAMGRLKEAAFAQTPKDNWTPSGSNPWYDATHRAKTRARAHFEYDDGGRPTLVNYWWDTINTAQTAYTSTFIRGNSAAYELSGLNRGLKTSSTYWVPSANGPAVDRTETFGYDANLDYLTSANYGSGSTVTWATARRISMILLWSLKYLAQRGCLALKLCS